jgi:hypothetical protein
MHSPRHLLLIALASSILFGCAESPQVAETTEPQALTATPPDKVMVVFLRPSFFGGAIHSSVFDITTEPITLIGILSPYTKVAYTTTPGARRFMVIGETAEFMDATLEAGKTYYVRVTAHMGMWKARFSLDPVAHAASDTQLDADLAGTTWVTNTAASLKWEQANMTSIQGKETKYLQPWLAGQDKATLNADDGR